jgi:exopolysaccharide biosynthesis polyprenyl glycosylphosphotransferase
MVATYRISFVVLIRLMDVGLLLLAWAAGFAARWIAEIAQLSRFPFPDFGQFLPLIVLSVVLTPIVFAQHDLYQPRRSRTPWQELGAVGRSVLSVWVGTYLLAVLALHTLPSRIILLTMLAAWLALALAGRYWARRFLPVLAHWLGQEQSAAIIGSGRLAQKLCHTLRRQPWLGTAVRYFLVHDCQRKDLCGLPVYPIGQDIAEILRDKPVDIVFLALPEEQASLRRDLVATLADQNINVALVPDLLSVKLLDQDVIRLGDFWVFSLTHSQMSSWRGLVKRLIDVIGSLLGLLLLLPAFAVMAILVKATSRGPVFYSQTRSSLAGREFQIHKFRSMRVDAEAVTGAVWAKNNDPRVTRVGGFLRSTGLDELPQLWNVFTGDMSLVGPRPERPELIQRFQQTVPRYMLRSRVKAGMTGWAQINGWRGDTSLRKRLQYDLYYIANWSLALDLFILAATVPYCFMVRTPRPAAGPAVAEPDALAPVAADSTSDNT